MPNGVDELTPRMPGHPIGNKLEAVDNRNPADLFILRAPGHIRSHSKLRDELLNTEAFHARRDRAPDQRGHCDALCPSSSLSSAAILTEMVLPVHPPLPDASASGVGSSHAARNFRPKSFVRAANRSSRIAGSGFGVPHHG